MNTNPAGYTYSDYLAHKDDELYHFGIKGMHWGVRRFQRKDGSLTPAGRKHIKTNPSYNDDKEARKAKIKKIAKGVAITGAAVGAGYLAYRGYKKHKTNDFIRNVVSKADGPKPILALPQKKKMELSIVSPPKNQKPKRSRTAKEALEYLRKLHEEKGQIPKQNRKIVGKHGTYNSRSIKGGKLKNQTAWELYDRASKKYAAKEAGISKAIRNNRKVVDGPFGNRLPKSMIEKSDRIGNKLGKVSIRTNELQRYATEKANKHTRTKGSKNKYIDYSYLAKKYDRLSEAVKEQQEFLDNYNRKKRR